MYWNDEEQRRRDNETIRTTVAGLAQAINTSVSIITTIMTDNGLIIICSLILLVFFVKHI